jgi:hypothetical protein
MSAKNMILERAYFFGNADEAQIQKMKRISLTYPIDGSESSLILRILTIRVRKNYSITEYSTKHMIH